MYISYKFEFVQSFSHPSNVCSFNFPCIHYTHFSDSNSFVDDSTVRRFIVALCMMLMYVEWTNVTNDDDNDSSDSLLCVCVLVCLFFVLSKFRFTWFSSLLSLSPLRSYLTSKVYYIFCRSQLHRFWALKFYPSSENIIRNVHYMVSPSSLKSTSFVFFAVPCASEKIKRWDEEGEKKRALIIILLCVRAGRLPLRRNEFEFLVRCLAIVDMYPSLQEEWTSNILWTVSIAIDNGNRSHSRLYVSRYLKTKPTVQCAHGQSYMINNIFFSVFEKLFSASLGLSGTQQIDTTQPALCWWVNVCWSCHYYVLFLSHSLLFFSYS